MLVGHDWGGVIEQAPYRFIGNDPKAYWCLRCEDYVSEYSACPYGSSEPSGNDLGAPQSAPVDRSATEGVKGSQISDPVNSPDHYRWLPVEAIEITELFNFNMGNALKYIIRADHKGKPIEDLRKAEFYIRRELQRREATD